MSAAIKFATIASGFTLFSAGALFTLRNPQREFSRDALALEHTGEFHSRSSLKSKLYVKSDTLPKSCYPNRFINRQSIHPISSFTTVGGYEIKTTA